MRGWNFCPSWGVCWAPKCGSVGLGVGERRELRRGVRGACVSARCGLEARKDPVRVSGPNWSVCVICGRLALLVEKGASRVAEGGLRSLLELQSCLLGSLGPGAGNSGGPFLAGPSVPLSGRMGESWAGILAYGGPDRRSAIGLGLGSLSAGAGTRGPGQERGMGAWTLGSWESCGRRGAAREAGSDCIGKSFPLVPASGKSLGSSRVGSEPTAQGVGRAGAGPGAGGEGPWLASPSPYGGCGKLGEGMPGPFVLALLMAGRP